LYFDETVFSHWGIYNCHLHNHRKNYEFIKAIYNLINSQKYEKMDYIDVENEINNLVNKLKPFKIGKSLKDF
jgi:hypothetical protein